jgi:hypothetical protein
MDETPDPVMLKRRNAQALLAQGMISLDDYNALGRLHGFVSPEPRTVGAQVLTGASVLGYVLLALGAVAEIVATRHPEMRGPLETLTKIAELVGNSL